MDEHNLRKARRASRATPDTHYYFPAANSEYVIARLQAAQADQAGLALVDGEPGLGKTLTALRFLESMPESVNRVFLPLGRYTNPREFYQAILFDLGDEYQGLGEQESRLAVADRFLRSLSDGKSTILVVDEAHHLSTNLLEELRLLDNLESHSSKAVFTVLLGLPSLRRHLARPELAAFSQRIAVRSQLEPLSESEATQYVRHHLRLAGVDAQATITAEAFALLCTSCQGVPRLLNQAATLAFTFTEQAGETLVDVEAVLEALNSLGLYIESQSPEPDPDLPTDSRRTQPGAGSAAKRKPGKRRSA
jgi:general secretion pathway protein A